MNLFNKKELYVEENQEPVITGKIIFTIRKNLPFMSEKAILDYMDKIVVAHITEKERKLLTEEALVYLNKIQKELQDSIIYQEPVKTEAKTLRRSNRNQ